jgi:predicted esterase
VRLIFGFAAHLTESLWLSVSLFKLEASSPRQSRQILFELIGEAEPFRRESGKAARNNMSIKEDCSLPAQINLYFDLYRPYEMSSPLLITLHGYGANKRQMMREAKLMAPEGFAIASLQGPYQHIREPKAEGGPLRFGFGWLTNFRPEESHAIHHRALRELIETLAADGIAEPTRIFLLGFSQSCALNYRFAFAHPGLLRGVIGICGGIPGDWDTNSSYRPIPADVLHLAGTRDEFYTPERIRDYEQQLGTRARSVTFKSYDAAHEIVEEMRADVKQWLAEHIDD